MSPSMFSLFTAGLAAFAPLAAAYTTPTGDAPKGNPIAQPGLNTIVPVEESFTITWDPTTDGTVSLVLLKGPAENLIPVYAIAEEIENSGSYTWEPKSTLEPSEGAKGYGIQLIVDATGQYQYTTQFGISNKNYNKEETSSAAGYASAPSSYAPAPSAQTEVASANTEVASTHTGAPSSYASEAPIAPVATQSHIAPSEANATSVTAPAITATGMPHNGTVIQHTGSLTKVASPTGGSSNTTNIEASTGGASNMAASFGGLVIAAAVAVLAF